MSNMFMGTLTIKGPKTSTAIGMSLEEMDRPVSILLMKIMMVKTNDDDDVHDLHDVNDVVDNKDEDGDDNDNDSDVGALPRKHRPVLMGGDVQAEEGEDQDGGGPAQPRQGGRRGRGDRLLLFFLFFALFPGDCGATRGEPRHCREKDCRAEGWPSTVPQDQD